MAYKDKEKQKKWKHQWNIDNFEHKKDYDEQLNRHFQPALKICLVG